MTCHRRAESFFRHAMSLPRQTAILSAGSLSFGVCTAASAADPAIYFDQSSVIGIGDTITAICLPIQTAGGKFIFKNVTITLTVGATGNLAWATAKPVVATCPPLEVSNIRAGIYQA